MSPSPSSVSKIPSEEQSIVVSWGAIGEDEVSAGGLGVAVRNMLKVTGGHWFCVRESPDIDAPFSTRSEQWKKHPNVYTHTLTAPRQIAVNAYTYANQVAWFANHDQPERIKFTRDEKTSHGLVCEELADMVFDHQIANGLYDTPVRIDDFQVVRLVRRLKDRYAEHNKNAPPEQQITSKIQYHLHTPAPGRKIAPLASDQEFEDTGNIFESDFLGSQFGPAARGISTLDWLKKHNPEGYRAYMPFLTDMTFADAVIMQTEATCKNVCAALKIELPSGGGFPLYTQRTVSFDGRHPIFMNAPISVPTREIKRTFAAHMDGVGKHDIAGKWERIHSKLSGKSQALWSQVSPSTEFIVNLGSPRADISKGLVEYARQQFAILRDLPEWRGRFTTFMTMAPTREKIHGGKNDYADIMESTKNWFDRINAEFRTAEWTPAVYMADKIPNVDVFLNARAARFHGGTLRKAINCYGASREGLGLIVEEGIVGQDDLYPSFTAIGEDMGAAQVLGHLTYTFNPLSENALLRVLKAAEAIYSEPDEGIATLRRMHRDMMAHLTEEDLMSWVVRSRNTIDPKGAAKIRKTYLDANMALDAEGAGGTNVYQLRPSAVPT